MLRKYNLPDKTNLSDLLCLSKYLKVACKPAFFTSRMIGSYYDHYSYLFITCLVYVTSADKIEASRLYNNSNPGTETINRRGETSGAVGGIGTFGCSLNFIITCANALCEFHTTALNSTFLLLNSTFNVFAITTLVPILDSIM